MKAKLSAKAKQFKRSISPVRQIMSFADPGYIRGLGLNPEDLISFAGGWVNHAAPEGLRRAYADIVNDPTLFHRSGAYPHTLGAPEFKQAVIEFERAVYGVTDLNPSQIAVGLGSTQSALALFEVLLDPGDKVLLLDPSYCNYPTQLVATFSDVQLLRFAVLDEESWRYDADSRLDDFQKFVRAEQPKIILLISPDNPTSQVLSDRFVNGARAVAEETGAFVVIDYAYKEVVFGDDYPDYFGWGPSDNIIALRSNSKWGRGLGRRLGWVEAPAFVVEAMESIQNSTILCPDMLHQMAMARYMSEAVGDGSLRHYISDTSARYAAAAARTVQAINRELALPALEPEGGLYTCVRVGMDGGQFVTDALRNAAVLTVPGWGFGRTVRHAVRVSFGPLVNDLDRIDEGIARLGAYLRSRPGFLHRRATTAVADIA